MNAQICCNVAHRYHYDSDGQRLQGFSLRKADPLKAGVKPDVPCHLMHVAVACYRRDARKGIHRGAKRHARTHRHIDPVIITGIAAAGKGGAGRFQSGGHRRIAVTKLVIVADLRPGIDQQIFAVDTPAHCADLRVQRLVAKAH